MDNLLDAQLQRMETALETLLQSIITYNPSVHAADNLLQADDELSKGLIQLTRHQSNYTRILQLRHETAILDAQIKSSVQLLADVRNELLAIPIDTPKERSRPVPYKDLLAYAKNISPFTIPPAFRPKPAAKVAAIASDDNDGGVTTAPESNEHAIATSPIADTGAIAQQEDDAKRAINVLSDEQQAWIADLNNLPFQPWPGETEMALGALHVLNNQVINGNDPTDITRIVEEERAADEEFRRTTEEEGKKREAFTARVGASGVSSGAVAAAATAKPASEVAERPAGARFGLEDEDDSDED